MPTPTYTPLANITLGSSAASVTFSSISQLYRDLVLVVSNGKVTTGAYDIAFRINSDTGSNYSRVYMTGNGSGSGGSGSQTGTYGRGTVDDYMNTTDLAGTIFQVMDYSATDKHKTVLARGGRASGGTSATANRWANTAAVTTFVVAPEFTGTFAAGSTFALYGIAA